MIALIVTALNIYSYIILARVLMSWIPLDRSNPTVDRIVQGLYDITEPVLQPIRDNLPSMGGFDFSPLVVFIGINIVSSILLGLG
ncbi:MAG: YggT family protein [Chloroflexota bacterium]